ncbi:MAG: hypothetical protein AAFV93_07850 [Chloroflexota bacterium]
MEKVLIKEKYQYILTLHEQIPAVVTENNKDLPVSGEIPKSVRRYMLSNPLRPILIHGTGIDNGLYLYYVLWYLDDADKIEQLDDRIVNFQKYQNLFSNTVVLDYQKTRCLGECGTWWDTLIMPFYGYRISDNTSLNQMRGDNYEECPRCHGSFRQPIVFVLGEAENN